MNWSPRLNTTVMTVLDAYGLVHDPNLTKDQTTAFQALVDYVSDQGGGAIDLPPCKIGLTQVRGKKGVHIIGSGMGPHFYGGTEFCRLPGATGDFFINDPTQLPIDDYWAYTRFENFRCTDDVSNTVGSAIGVNCRGGEGLSMRWLLINGFAEHNIHFKQGAGPLHLHNLHLFGARNGAGLFLDRTGNDTLSCATVNGLSGDNNSRALVLCHGAGTVQDVLTFRDIKAESWAAGKQNAVIELWDMFGAFVNVDTMTASSSQTGNPETVFRITGTGIPRLQYRNVRAATTYEYLVKNDNNSAYNILNPGLNAPMQMGHSVGELWSLPSTTPSPLKVYATADLPVATATRDGKMFIEDTGTGHNLVVYMGGLRKKVALV